MHNLIACGCSWTLGTYSKLTDPLGDSDQIWENLQNQSYAQSLPDCDTTMWAQNGISNYAIACQVSDAIESDCDIIVFNTTTTSRYDIARPNQPQGKTWCLHNNPWDSQSDNLEFYNDYRKGSWPRPHRHDFFDHDTQPNGTIISKSLSQFNNYTKYTHVMDYLFAPYKPGFNSEDAQRYMELQTHYSDWGIKHHTDTMIVKSTISDLEASGKSWICVDVVGIAPDHDRVHRIDLASMLKQYPQSGDQAHWSQLGHNKICQDLTEKYF